MLADVAGTFEDAKLIGVAFDPTGSRLFFASQCAAGVGEIYELRGSF